MITHETFDSITKVDMVSIILSYSAHPQILDLFEDKERCQRYGVIKLEGRGDILAISCVSSYSRDELYEVLIKTLVD